MTTTLDFGSAQEAIDLAGEQARNAAAQKHAEARAEYEPYRDRLNSAQRNLNTAETNLAQLRDAAIGYQTREQWVASFGQHIHSVTLDCVLSKMAGELADVLEPQMAGLRKELADATAAHDGYVAKVNRKK